MIRRKLLYPAILALAVLALFGAAALAGDTLTVTYDIVYQYDMAREVLQYTNEFRTSATWYWNSDDTTKTTFKKGELGALEYDYGLEKAAMERAAEIAVYFAHQRPNGEMCYTVHDAVSGENIAAGKGMTEDAESVVMAWREDEDPYAGQGHRRNMLRAGYTVMGVGCVKVDGVTYWAQEFGYEATGESAKKFKGAKTTVVDPSVLNNIGTPRVESDGITVTAGETIEIPKVSIELGWSLFTTATVNDVAWKSSKSTVASVSGNTVTGKKAGTAVLSATVFGQAVKVKVTVKAAPAPAGTDIAKAFPDAAFREFIAANFDTNGDGALSEAEVRAVKAIDISGVGAVKDLTGIALFTELETLDASNNQLTWLDLDANTKLTGFTCAGNVLKVKAPGGKYDLSAIAGLDAGRMSGLKNASLKDTVLTAVKPVSASYNYDCGGGFTARFTLKMTAGAVEITSASLKKTSLVYTGEALTPAVTVKAVVNGAEQTLKKGQYKAVYENNADAGTATVTVTGTGFFKGTLTVSFRITKVSLSAVKLAYGTKTYTGKALKPGATVTAVVNGETVTLKKTRDYTVTYKDNVNAGTATVTVKGKGNFKGTLTETFTIKPVKLSSAALEFTTAGYTGKAIKPKATVEAKVNGKTVTLTAGTDYTVTYKNNKAAGTATVTIKGIGNFTGKIVKTFTIEGK